MVRDVQTVIVNESIRRLVDECEQCPNLDYDILVGHEHTNPETARRLAALSAAMQRIIYSAKLN